MTDRIVVLKNDDAIGFVADACAALAAAVNEIRVSRSGARTSSRRMQRSWSPIADCYGTNLPTTGTDPPTSPSWTTSSNG